MDWIDIDDALPVEMNWVLVTTRGEPYAVAIARWDGSRWDFLLSNCTWTYGVCKWDATTPIDIQDIGFWLPLPTRDCVC